MAFSAKMQAITDDCFRLCAESVARYECLFNKEKENDMAKRKMETETAEIPTNETVKLSDMDASEPVGERPTPQDTRHLTAIRLDELGAAQERARALDQQLAIAAELMAGMIASGDRRGMGERARDAVAGAKALLDENMK